MAIGPIELNGSIPRVSDYATIKQNEDNKGVIQQNGLHVEARKEEQSKASEVNRGEETSRYLRKFDAKEKGDGEYAQNGGQKKKKKADGDGTVVMKGTSTFDIRI